MKTKLPVLEYSSVGGTTGKRGQWTFRFITPGGVILIESGANFSSKAEAERGFVSLIKSVASNEYRVTQLFPSSRDQPNSGSSLPRR